MPLVSYVRGRDKPGPKRVFLALPTSSGFNSLCVASLIPGVTALEEAGIAVDVCIEAGNCHVDDARNSLVREFMKTDCTDLVFIDDDVGFYPADLVKLVRVDRDLCAGVYPKKQDPADYPVHVEPGTDLYVEDDGFVEVHGAPTGFMRISRAALVLLLEAHKEASFIGQAGEPEPYTVLFERTIENGRRWSGDYAFCLKWRALGGRIYVDPTMRFTHTGANTWSGALGDFWLTKHGLKAQSDEKRFAAAIETLRAGYDDDAFVTLHTIWNNPYSPDPAFLAAAYMLAKEHGEVLECGSGLTTIVMALAGTKLTALEHNPIWAGHTQAVLDRYGLKADLRCAPLVDGWYDYQPGKADVIVIDGPPYMLSDRTKIYQYAVGATLLVDDTTASLADALSLFGEVKSCDLGGRSFALVRPTT